MALTSPLVHMQEVAYSDMLVVAVQQERQLDYNLVAGHHVTNQYVRLDHLELMPHCFEIAT